jgi:DnaJ domain
MKNPYQVLGIKPAATEKDVATAYHRLVRKYHPDVNPSPSAAERLLQINAAHELLADPARRLRFDEHGATELPVVTTKRGTYQQVVQRFSGEVADIFQAQGPAAPCALKVARSAADSDLMAAEAAALQRLRPAGSPEEQGFRYFTPLLEAARLADGRRLHVLPWLAGFYSLAEVRVAFPAGVPFEHAVWMFYRVLEALAHVHRNHQLVHGGVTPAHVMIYGAGHHDDPWNHGAKLIDWTQAVVIGGQVPLVSPDYQDRCAPEILQKQPVTIATDLYMAAQCFGYALGADAAGHVPARVPDYLASFLRGCLLPNPSARPATASALRQELKDHMRTHYGPRKYIPFAMPVRA